MIKDQIKKYFFKRNLLSHFGFLNNLSTNKTIFGTVIDIGAYKGEFTESFLRFFPNSLPILIEAQTSKIENLKSKYSLVFNEVLSDVSGKSVTFYNFETGSSYFPEKNVENPGLKESRLTISFDDLIQRNSLEIKEPVFLKIDTQGSELEILRGASNLLNKTSYILIELSLIEYNLGAPTFFEMIEFLNSLNFKLFDIIFIHRDKKGYAIQIDAVFKK
jgi:FkbM family methyltransferase